MNSGNRFLALLERDGPALLDGGLATQLEAQGCEINDALWSAGLLLTAPQEIVNAHRAFIDAGAECVATAGYQASREGFAQKGLSADEADALMLKSIDLVRQAATEADKDVAVAASLGPYGAMLHNGSEYHGDYGVDGKTLRRFHEVRFDVLENANVDVVALETIPSLQEATALARVLDGRATPAWISFSCRDG
ncbi:MAG: homocysteine S-methyltransferase, partial [Pseudomonadota bacterium]